MRKLIAIVLTLVMIACMMAACNKEPHSDKVEIVTGAETIAEHDATVYLIDSWREDAGDGARTYYATILMYSEDFYDAPTVDDIKYKTENGYEKLVDMIDDASIVIYDVNNQPVSGVCSYAKIKTSKLIDTKKIYVYFAGPVEYNQDTLTVEAYKAANGSLDGWVEVLSNVTEKAAPNDAVAELQTDVYSGVIKFVDDYSSLFYYSSSIENPVVEGNRLLARMDVDNLKEQSIDTFVSNVVSYGEVANLVADGVEKIELDERLKITGEVIDGEVWIGFETVDGSDFSAYDGEIPDAIVYHTLRMYSFVVNK